MTVATHFFRKSFAGLLALAVASSLACGTTKAERRYSKEEAATALSRFESTGLVIGEFPIEGANAVIDGDTIRVKGLSSSMRLLAIDTEETFKHDSERKAYSAGWAEYKKKMRGDSPHPVKMASPLGDDAKRWAEGFFEGVTSVRLERDHPGEIRDYYGRYLAYVFVEKNGKWVNYNLECVRAGYTPYFSKYGRSRRFHADFVDAQQKARAAHLHIWDPNRENYGDYPERLEWWDGRGEQVARFEKEGEENSTYIALTRWDALRQLEANVGKTVTLLGAVGEVSLGDRGPSIVKLSRSRGSDFQIVFFDKDAFLASGVTRAKGEFIQVRGVVSRYVDKRRGSERLQIVVNLPSQVLVPASTKGLPEAYGPTKDESEILAARKAAAPRSLDDEPASPPPLISDPE